VRRQFERRAAQSARNASIGSILAARRAGARLAAVATVSSAGETTARTIASMAPTPNSSDCNRLVTAHAPASPSAIPATASRTDCMSTIRATSPIRAPSAMRTPISNRRCVTMYEITP
jgi:hypothetical protein